MKQTLWFWRLYLLAGAGLSSRAWRDALQPMDRLGIAPTPTWWSIRLLPFSAHGNLYELVESVRECGFR